MRIACDEDRKLLRGKVDILAGDAGCARQGLTIAYGPSTVNSAIGYTYALAL
jgi:hypothetical protein